MGKRAGRVLSGIRATGRLHLGNYLGAVKGMLALQERAELECFFMVADLHTITTPYDRVELSRNRREVLLDYLASGLDPRHSTLFIQSMVPAHTELAFYLSSLVTIARMQHLPTFKEKVRQHPQHVTMALLNYPLLMASDILLYQASLVPVGLDQEPHLEVARELVRKLRAEYGLELPEPERFVTPGEYVPSLKGEGKMSKSVEGSYIQLTDDEATVSAKLAACPTDGGRGRVTAFQVGERGTAYRYTDERGEESAGVESLLSLVSLIQGEERRQAYHEQYTSTGLRYRDLKAELAAAISELLRPIQARRARWEADEGALKAVIEAGAKRARALAEETLTLVRAKLLSE